jgi:hypothetical protein
MAARARDPNRLRGPAWTIVWRTTMHLPASRLALRRLGTLTALALLGSLLVNGSALAGSGSTTAHDRFRPSASDTGEAGEAGDTRDPAHFDAEAAANPVKGAAALFSQCRFAPFAGQTNLYSSFAPNEHDVVIGDTSFAFADGTTCFNPQNEQNIVVNPTNRNNIVTSANDYRGNGICVAYVSMDGGATWHDHLMSGWTSFTTGNGVFLNTGCGGDPVLAFGQDGTLYYVGLTFNVDKFPRQMSGVAISKSTDGGVHWSKPVMISYNASGNFFFDKPWVSVSNDGTVNVTWTKFFQGPLGVSYVKSPIVISQSHNGGKQWTPPVNVSDASHPFDQGSQSGMAPDGTLYVTYEAGDPDTGYNTDALIVASSTDGGASFSTHKVARVFDDLDCYPIQLPGGQGRQTLTGEQFRLAPYPSLAIDPTNGLIAIAWADDEGAGTCGNGGSTFSGTTSNQVKLLTSLDGSSWTLRHVTSTAPDKFYASVGANNGVIAVGYETRDYATAPNVPLCEARLRDATTGDITVLSTANVCYDQAVRLSSDGGATWSSQIRVSSQSSNPYVLFAGAFIGDYEGTAVDDQGNVFTVWTDNRGLPGVTPPNQDTMVGVIPGD